MSELLKIIESNYNHAVYWWLVSALLIVFFMVLEKAFPAEDKQTVEGRVRNVIYSVLYLLFGTLLATVLLLSVITFDVADDKKNNLLESFFVISIALFITDFCYYWYHRAQHAFPVLWAIHELHHADDEMNATTSWRTHFLEQPVQLVLVSLPSLILFPLIVEKLTGSTWFYLASSELLVYTLIATFLLVASHANIRLALGYFGSWVTGPQYHRVHHSVEKQHWDKNFAQYFPVLDRVFGTYHSPTINEFPNTGIVALASNENPLKAAFRPFVIWKNMLKK